MNGIQVGLILIFAVRGEFCSHWINAGAVALLGLEFLHIVINVSII